MVYYNEFDPAAAAWLRELMAAGLIPRGVVDERSIQEVRPADVAGFSQCHFFGGVGGWAHALALAGWSGPVWTGSCPCQPFSPAGRRKGKDDARHLWPDFHRLIGECRPPVVFGEQVARRDGLHWLAGVRTDLEGLGYAVGAADLAAAGVGAPHIRQRLFWVADGAAGGRGHAGPEPLPGGVAGAFGGRPHGRVGLAEGEGREVPEPPALRDAGRGGKKGEDLNYQATLSGPTSSSSPAPTEPDVALNPEFTRWLMGYPVGWGSSGATAMRSCRRSRRRS